MNRKPIIIMSLFIQAETYWCAFLIHHLYEHLFSIIQAIYTSDMFSSFTRIADRLASHTNHDCLQSRFWNQLACV